MVSGVAFAFGHTMHNRNPVNCCSSKSRYIDFHRRQVENSCIQAIMEKTIIILLLCIASSFHSVVSHVMSPPEKNDVIHIRKHLPIGHRVDGFLPVDKPARYYVAISGSPNTLTIRVTPCESPIFWSLSIQSTHDRRTPWAGNEDNMAQWESKQHHYPDIRRLFSFQGNGEESFTTAVVEDGIFLIDLISLESDTNFQVFVSDNRNHYGMWPQLPTDPRVEVLSVEEDRVELSWKPSLGDTTDARQFDYCVFVNKHHNVRTLCATEFNMKRQSNHHWDEQESKPIKSSRSSMATSKRKHRNFKGSTMDGNSNNELWSSKSLGGHRVCVGHWANATISKLKPRTLYYFDVFAVNPHTGTSVTYTGTFAETKHKNRSHLPKLPDEEMVNIFLKSKGLKILKIELPTRGFKWLFVHSCLHKVHIHITVNGKVITSKSLQGAHNFKLAGSPKDNCIITLKSSRGGPSLVKLFSSTAHHHMPFPNLSPDINLSVSNASCSSATVTWTGTGQGTKYCIYARHLEHNLDLKLIHKLQNSCLSTSTRSRAEKVICRQEGPQTLTEEQITDLKPGKAYLLDLYLLGLHNNTIKFPSRVVRTQGWCT
ncbi:protein NDNF-like [Rhinophrynus dorsalis]